LQFLNDTSYQTTVDHAAKPMTKGELDQVESRMMMRYLHLTERCAVYGLDQPGKRIVLTLQVTQL